MKENSTSQKAPKSIKPGWVFVSKDNKRVLAHAKTFGQLLRSIEQKGNPKGSISIVPPENFSSYVG